MPPIRVEIEGQDPIEFPEGTDPNVIDMVVKRDFIKPQQPQETGFFEDLRNASRQRGLNVTNPKPSAVGRVSPIAGNTLNVVAQGAGLGADIVGAGVKQGMNALGSLGRTAGYGYGIDKAKEFGGKVVQEASNVVKPMWENVNKFDSGFASDLERLGTIGTMLPLPSVAKKITPAVQEASSVAKRVPFEVGATVDDAVRVAQNKISPKNETIYNALLDKEIKNTVRTNISKAIKTSTNNSTWKMLEKYFDNAETGVVEIIKNKNNLNLTNDVGDVVSNTLPKTRMQMLEAIDKTDERLFKQFEDMAKSSTGKGVTLNLLESPAPKLKGQKLEKTLLGEIDDFINDPALKADINGQRLIKHAERQKKAFEGVGELTPLEAQRWITNANARMNDFFKKGGNLKDGATTAFDAGLASIMRNKLDRLISRTEGVGYSDFKRKYGAVKSLRDGTSKAAIASTKEINIPNFFDITSGTALAHGIMTANPVTLGATGFMEGLNLYRKHLTNPDNYVTKMFLDVENALTKKTTRGKFVPESQIGKVLYGNIQKNKKLTKEELIELLKNRR